MKTEKNLAGLTKEVKKHKGKMAKADLIRKQNNKAAATFHARPSFFDKAEKSVLPPANQVPPPFADILAAAKREDSNKRMRIAD